MKKLAWLEEDPDAFPPTSRALDNPNGLLAAGGDLSSSRLLQAYSRGIFPWFNENEPILWWTPNPRMVIEPSKVHISKSLRKHIRQNNWRATMDCNFQDIIEECSAPRSYADGTWITEDMKDAYIQLHELGCAHSIEIWNDADILVGGLYGVSLGNIFFGESMFSAATNGSKVALVYLCNWLNVHDFALLDCQVANNHLESMGGIEIQRADFEAILSEHITPELCMEKSELWRKVKGKELDFDGSFDA